MIMMTHGTQAISTTGFHTSRQDNNVVIWL